MVVRMGEALRWAGNDAQAALSRSGRPVGATGVVPRCRWQVLACSRCHRFLGGEGAQLAMLDGLPREERPADPEGCGAKRKRPGAPRAAEAPSRRLGVALARPREVSRLPALVEQASVDAGPGEASPRRVPGTDRTALARDGAPAGREGPGVPEGKRVGTHDGNPGTQAGGGSADTGGTSGGGGAGWGAVGGGLAYPCEGGAPCDELYCSPACRRAAMAGGHALICPGGSEEGRQGGVWHGMVMGMGVE